MRQREAFGVEFRVESATLEVLLSGGDERQQGE